MNVGAVTNEVKRRQYASLWQELERRVWARRIRPLPGPHSHYRGQGKARENLLKEFQKVYDNGVLEKGEKSLQMVNAYRDHYASQSGSRTKPWTVTVGFGI